MTVINGRFVPKTEEELLAEMLDAAEEAWGRELSDDETATIVDFYRPLAAHFAEQQADLVDILDATQLRFAEGDALDYLGDLVGVPRRDELAASGRIQFANTDPVTRSYSIPSGSRVQTDDADPVVFETDVTGSLPYLDGFEAGNLADYQGDTGSFDVTQTQVNVGDYSLEVTGSGEIINPNDTFEYGSEIYVDLYLTSGAEPSLIFGGPDLDNHYKVVFDQTDSETRFVSVEDNTDTTVETETQSLPTGEWLTVAVQWAIDGDHTVTITDSSDSEILSLTASETEVAYNEGGFGFASANATTAYFDELTTRYVSIEATATGIGEQTNVGPESLIILSSSINGVDEVTNPLSMSGGRAEEEDDDYRERIQDDLAEGTSATLPAVINALEQLPETKTVTVINNRSADPDGDGRPGKSIEAIVDVQADDYTTVAEALLSVVTAGEDFVGGYAGTEVTRSVELSNGQTETVTFSTPSPVVIEVDVSLEKTDNYAGNDRVRNNIVQYIGGTLFDGNTIDGDLDVGDDVIYNKIIGAITETVGVHDITSLQIRESGGSFGSSNITISDTENATADATDASLDISTTDI